MSNWIIRNIEPSLSSLRDGDRVARFAQSTYTLEEMSTGEIKKVTCGLQDKWADSFLVIGTSHNRLPRAG
jgi:hypothetical protein